MMFYSLKVALLAATLLVASAEGEQGDVGTCDMGRQASLDTFEERGYATESGICGNK